jgi:flagellar basal body rod protein FlgC
MESATMNSSKLIMVAAATLMLSTAAGLATAQSDSSSLAQSMQFVGDIVTAQGAVSFTGTVHDSSSNSGWTYSRKVTVSNFSPDPANCKLNFHFNEATPGNPDTDKDGWIPFREVQQVKVETLDEEVNEITAKQGHPTWLVTHAPTIYVVSAIRPDGATNDMDFYDLSKAQRVAIAIRRATKLCGGGLG